MGNIQSETTRQTLSEYTSVVNAAVADFYNQNQQQCASANEVSIATGQGCLFEFYGGSFNITQQATSNCNFNSQNINTAGGQFNTAVTNATKNFINQNAQNKQGWFATAFSLQIAGATNATDVTNLISNSFTGNVTNICSAIANSYNVARVVNLCGVFNGATFNIDQDAMVTALTSCVNDNVIKVFTTNTILNQLWQATDQKLASEQRGAESLFIWIAIIVGVIVVIIIIGVIIYIIYEGRQTAAARQSQQQMLTTAITARTPTVAPTVTPTPTPTRMGTVRKLATAAALA